MPQFRLVINLDTFETLRTKKSIALALFHVAAMMDTGESSKGNVFDEHGNIVGHYEVVDR